MTSATASRPKTGLIRFTAATGAAVIVAVGVDALIAAISHGIGVSADFKPLYFSSFASLTVIGVLVAAITWAIIRARAARPFTILRTLVPVVVVLSLVPDLILGFGKQQAHTTWGGVAALALMHLTVSAVAVAAFVVGMPTADADRSD